MRQLIATIKSQWCGDNFVSQQQYQEVDQDLQRIPTSNWLPAQGLQPIAQPLVQTAPEDKKDADCRD